MHEIGPRLDAQGVRPRHAQHWSCSTVGGHFEKRGLHRESGLSEEHEFGQTRPAQSYRPTEGRRRAAPDRAHDTRAGGMDRAARSRGRRRGAVCACTATTGGQSALLCTQDHRADASPGALCLRALWVHHGTELRDGKPWGTAPTLLSIATAPRVGAVHRAQCATTLRCVPTNSTRRCGRRCWPCSRTPNSSTMKSTEGLRRATTASPRDGEPTRCTVNWPASPPGYGACSMPTRKKSSPSTSCAREELRYKPDNVPILCELEALKTAELERGCRLSLATTMERFLQRMRNGARSMSLAERQRVVRLLVREVQVAKEEVTVCHSIPIEPSSPSRSGPSHKEPGESASGQAGLLDPSCRQIVEQDVETRVEHRRPTRRART